MRLFVGVPLTGGAADRVSDAISSLKPQLAERFPSLRAAWVERAKLHVTIRFIGAVPDAQGAAITAALAPPMAQAAFRLTLGAVAPFPPGGRPRGLWARIDEGAEELRALEREVSTRLHDGAGVPGESRAFTPHVTLARLHDPPRAARTIGTDRFAGGTMRVDAVTLFESRLSPKGAEYVPLQRTPLAHAAGDAG